MMELTEKQVNEMARYFVNYIDTVKAFYADEENENAYQEWLKQRNANQTNLKHSN